MSLLKKFLSFKGIMKVINKINEEILIYFDKGIFDNFCVYFSDNGNKKIAPKDVEYFSEFKKLSKFYPKYKVYDDFVSIYEVTGKEIDKNTVNLIKAISNTYHEEHKRLVEILFSIIYGGMITEENKERAILKKRMKRLGMHQLLVLDFSPFDAARFSRGKKARELNRVMQSYGF